MEEGQNNEQPKITIEQIQTAISNNSELESQIVTTMLQTETGKSVLNNHLKTSKGEIYNEATKGAYTNVDTKLASLGYDKPEGVKSTDYLESVLVELANKAKSVDSTKEEKEDAKKLIDTLKTDFTTKETQYQSEIDKLKQEVQTVKIQSEIKAIKWDLDPVYDNTIGKNFVATEEGKLVKSAKIVEGQTVYHDENGNPYLNEKRDYATAKEILSIKLKDVLKKQPNAGGGASQEKAAQTTQSKDGVIMSDKLQQAKTKVEFYTFFQEAAKRQGLTEKEEINNAWANTRKHYNIDRLPEH